MSDVYVEMETGKAADEHHGTSSWHTTKQAERIGDTSSRRGCTAQYRAFISMAMPYFYEQRQGRLFFGVMIALTLLNSGVRVVFSYLARDFWSALSENRPEDFYAVMRNFLLALIVLAPINVLYRYQRQALAIHWRQWMTLRVLELYFSNRVYYGLERLASSSSTTTAADDKDGNKSSTSIAAVVDNPDQRIAEDVRSFTEFSLTLFLTVLMAVVDLICFSFILFTIMPKLFLAISLFALFGTAATILIGRVLVQLNFEKLQREADFRYALVRVRDNAESICFLQGEPVEQHNVSQSFCRVIQNMQSVNTAVRNLDFFTTYYTYLTWVLPILVVAPEYFAGAVELGVVQQAAASFSHVLDDLSILVTQWESLAEFSAGIDRLHTFLTVAQALDPDRPSDDTSRLMVLPPSLETQQQQAEWEPPSVHKVTSVVSSDYANTTKTSTGVVLPPRHSPSSSTIRLQYVSADAANYALTIQNLTLTTPSANNNASSGQRTLITNLNLSVKWGENLLICGASGRGKSSLLRAIAGLWNTGSGSIARPHGHDIYFLPQKPYCTLGSLRDQLLYPSCSISDADNLLDHSVRRPRGGYNDATTALHQQALSDHDLLEILRNVDLADLPRRAAVAGNHHHDASPIQGLDIVLDWSNMLSLGEQQRLAFGRVLVNRPRFLIMDEGTSALDAESERRMYAVLARMSSPSSGVASKLTYVSVGHRPTLLAHHDTKLILDGHRCIVEPIHHPQATTGEAEPALF